LTEVIPWLLDYYKRTYNPEVGHKSLDAERLRLLSAQADREALDNARRRVEVIEYDEAEGCITALAALVANRLEGVAGRLANELVNASNPAIIRG
jgi:phage terminase Nu1 subunit (DNA packaging protein)